MAVNPFDLAVKVVINKKLTAKKYLIEVEGKTKEEVENIISEIKNAFKD